MNLAMWRRGLLELLKIAQNVKLGLLNLEFIMMRRARFNPQTSKAVASTNFLTVNNEGVWLLHETEIENPRGIAMRNGGVATAGKGK